MSCTTRRGLAFTMDLQLALLFAGIIAFSDSARGKGTAEPWRGPVSVAAARARPPLGVRAPAHVHVSVPAVFGAVDGARGL